MVQIYGSGPAGYTNTAVVTDEGRLLVDMSGVSLFIGSVSANVDSVYIQSGDNVNLGTTWTGVGSVVVSGTVATSTTLTGSLEVFQTTNSDLQTQISGVISNRVAGSIVNIPPLFVQSGAITTDGLSPLDSLQNNPLLSLDYVVSGTSTGVTGSEIGSIIQFIGAGSFVQVLGYSGNLLIKIGSWS